MNEKFGQFFASYGEFHDNAVNKAIHIICIPSITFTMFYLLFYVNTPLPIALPYLIFMILSFVYLSRDLTCGAITVTWLFIQIVITKGLYTTYHHTKGDLFNKMLFVHIIAWALQIVGHMVFEKRNPAFNSNILLAAIAPFFVTAEILLIFGWRKDFFAEVQEEIDTRIKKYREGLKK